GVVAVVRRGSRQGRRSGGAGADQRQGARAGDRVGRCVGGSAPRDRARRPDGQDAHRRQDHPQGRRREGTARQRGGFVNPGRFSLRVLRGGVFALAIAASGCGYSLAGRGSFLPSYVKTIGIPTFVNRTTVFNLETLLTQKVRAEFIGRGKY